MVCQPEMVRQCNSTFYCAELHNISNGTTEHTTKLYRTIFPSVGKLCVYRCLYGRNDDQSMYQTDTSSHLRSVNWWYCAQVVAAGMFYGDDAYFNSGWNIMDGSLVSISIIDLLMSLVSDSSPRIFGILRVIKLRSNFRLSEISIITVNYRYSVCYGHFVRYV